MTLCEHPITGEILSIYGKDCPAPFVERVAGKSSMQGIHFISEEVYTDSIKKKKSK